MKGTKRNPTRRTALLTTLCATLLLGGAFFAADARAEVIIGEYVQDSFGTGEAYPAAREGNPGNPELTWAEVIDFPGATYIAPHFDLFHLPPGDFLVVRSPDGSQSWTYENLGRASLGLSEEGFFATHIKGDSAILELYSVSAADALRGGSDTAPYGFSIDYFGRGYNDDEISGFWAAGLGDEMNLPRPIEHNADAICGSDDSREAKCYQSSEPSAYGEARAVARLVKSGRAHCTGWLIGCEGHLMTNEHCVASQSELNSIDIEFMAEGSSCATDCRTALGCSGTVEASGGTLVQVDAGLDYALLIPNTAQNLSNTYGYMQLRDTGAVLGERIYIPQHPSGWGKRIAVESSHPSDGGLAQVNSLTEPGCSSSSYNDVGYFADTRGGSSGSPVLGYGDDLVIALHHCANCENRGVPIQRIIADLGANLPDCSLGGGTPPPPPPECPAGSIDFDSFALQSYSNQDAGGSAVSTDGGTTLTMTGNTWKQSAQTFNVTAGTVVEFEFASSSQGEIHAIGFDEDADLNNNARHFQFYGSQNWTGGGKIDYTPKYTGGGAFQSFSIPVGQSYTGSSMRLIFTNDNDAGTSNQGQFRCVRVTQGTPPPTCSVQENFEGGAGGWFNSAASTCATGAFVVATPNQIVDGGVTTQVGGDHTSGSGNAFFSATNTSAGVNDVDGGNCIVESPTYPVSEASDLSIWYFHGQRDAGDDAAGDFFRLEISTNGGATYSTLAAFGDVTVNAGWTQATASVPAGSNVKLRVQASDGAGPGDLIEAGIDDLTICPSN